MNWKAYEQYIHNYFTRLYPDATITHNAKKLGIISKVERQIDILIEGTLAGYPINVVIDCKCLDKKVDVKTVESFLGFLQDVKANKGLLITNKGYTSAAENRAKNNNILDLELRIIEFDDLEAFQGFGGIVYQGSVGVIISPPDGWIIDARQYDYTLATLYPIGKRFEEALESNEYMYVWIIKKTDIHPDLESLIKFQEKYTKERYPNCQIEYFEKSFIENIKSKLRLITLLQYLILQYTGFIEFEDFIFYCVLVTPKKFKLRNLKKLEQILRKAIPLAVTVEEQLLVQP